MQFIYNDKSIHNIVSGLNALVSQPRRRPSSEAYAAVNDLAIVLFSEGKTKEDINVFESALRASPASLVMAEPFLFSRCVYENLGPPRVLDADLLVPAMDAYTFTKRMHQEQGFDLWNCKLHDLRAFVKECRDGWPGVASPKKGLPVDDCDASIKELAVRFDSDVPDLSVFALVDMRASLAYETCYPGNENFAFAVAFRDLCKLKAMARGDAKPIVKELAETLTMGKSTRTTWLLLMRRALAKHVCR
ncbi:hypothetical protein K488DRAFT_91008 [Vararia minispora EC-137]|uniref:Uncharacterized protein n=1 Tax=Vararia minispora EC-137 TaxID=1314806 RepID=A0ACB8Q756_9AGAM|nr:hypothetical protein K488DRAFT_91008 [Vararia minispora EC-137]